MFYRPTQPAAAGSQDSFKQQRSVTRTIFLFRRTARQRCTFTLAAPHQPRVTPNIFMITSASKECFSTVCPSLWMANCVQHSIGLVSVFLSSAQTRRTLRSNYVNSVATSDFLHRGYLAAKGKTYIV